jgi:hypothetical protein
VRLRGLDFREGAQDGGFFAAHRAAGDEHRAVRREPEETQDPFTRLAVRRGRSHFERVELQAAGDGDARRIGAEIDQAVRRLLALHAEAIDVGEHAAEQRAHEPVARVRARGNAAVDHRRPDAPLPAFVQQVRPDLGLHHDEQPRLDDVQRAAGRDDPVEWEIEHPVQQMAKARSGHLLPRQRRR